MSETSTLRLDKALSINGWMSHSELEFLARTARKCNIVIEIGCYLGRSTRAILDNTDAFVFAVDPWNGYYSSTGVKLGLFTEDDYEHFRANVKEYLESGQLEILKCRSDEFPNDFGKGYSDFTFIDGDHRYSQVVKDIQLAKRITRKGGIIAGHDYTHVSDWPGVKQAVDEIYPEAQKADSIWWIKNK